MPTICLLLRPGINIFQIGSHNFSDLNKNLGSFFPRKAYQGKPYLHKFRITVLDSCL